MLVIDSFQGTVTWCSAIDLRPGAASLPHPLGLLRLRGAR